MSEFLPNPQTYKAYQDGIAIPSEKNSLDLKIVALLEYVHIFRVGQF